MAGKAEDIGVAKARLGVRRMFALAVLAGAFIALGAIFATVVGAGGMAVKAADGSLAFTPGLPYGVVRLLTGLVFTLGLVLAGCGRTRGKRKRMPYLGVWAPPKP
jgi:formate/nitrite transporter FocA (FNT family)